MAASERAPSPSVTAAVSAGRPPEIEEWLNTRFFHPLARWIARLLIPTPVTPNAVSIAGVFAMAAAAACYAYGAWPWLVVAGFGFHLLWHVLDGADGDLARRTGRASPDGEIVDGVCDHLSHVILYLAMGVILSRHLGGWGWGLAIVAGLSRGLQSSCYERTRRNYRRWVHGVSWIRQELAAPADAGQPPNPWRRLSRVLAGAYLGASSLVSADDRRVEASMSRLMAAGGDRARAAQALYAERQRPLVKHASALSTNYETLGIFLILMIRQPPLLFVFEAVLLNLVMALLVVEQRAAYRDLERQLARLEAG